MNSRNKKALTAAITGALLASSFAVSAQQGGGEESAGVMEEVVVTSRKREETLQDVPISVSATTEQQLTQRGLTSIEDVARTVASFSVQKSRPRPEPGSHSRRLSRPGRT